MSCPYCASIYGSIFSSTTIVCFACGQLSATALWKTKPTRKRKRYEDGSHGAKKREQKRLKTSGKTHQSEHVVGYEVFGHGAKRQGSEFAKTIENFAPAYQEEKVAHRGHIGTGNWKDYRGTGESSEQYRINQRRMVRVKRVGNAVQLNQLYYANQPEFRSIDPSKKSNLKKADDSYQKMVENFPPVPFWDGKTLTKVGVTTTEKAEMNLARMTARNGKYPSRQEELYQMKKCGIISGELLEKPKKGPPLPFSLDKHGILKDGNCLFHSIWAGLHSIMPDAVGFLSNYMLRKQAVGFLRYDPDLKELGVTSLEYFKLMEQDGTWAGELEAMALAHVWGVRITLKAPKYTIIYNKGAHVGFEIHYDGDSHYSVGPL